MSTSVLLFGVIFSSIGLGYCMYGKKQRAAVPLVCGLALMIFPYFVSSALVLIGLGTVICIIPWILRI